MSNLIQKIMSCDDINTIKNVSAIMAEFTDREMCGKQRLLMMKEIQSELTGSHYDEGLSDFHLALIGRQNLKEAASHYWELSKKPAGMTIHDWLVLWAEMDRRHGKVIRKWFPHISFDDFNDKLFDECVAFLESGGNSFTDLNP